MQGVSAHISVPYVQKQGKHKESRTRDTWEESWKIDTERMRVTAWRIKALFSRVAGNQQELDTQRLLARLGIWGPYYHCLSYWRDLHGGMEYPPAPYTPDTSVHSPHTHSSHTLNIGLSMLLILPLFQSTFGWNVSLPPEQKLSTCQ